MTLLVHVNLQAAAPAAPALLERAVVLTLREEGQEEATVSLTLLDDDGIAALNRRYLDRTGPTDVLAFALHGDGEPPLGDVYVGVDQAVRQADELGVPHAHELARLAIHGTLHVLGHDHPEGPEREASPMWALQERLLAMTLEA